MTNLEIEIKKEKNEILNLWGNYNLLLMNGLIEENPVAVKTFEYSLAYLDIKLSVFKPDKNLNE